MSAVPFHCPLCDGLFQVDDSLSGIEVNCPHCQGLVTVPDFAGPPLPPMSAAMELSCPVCTGLFQVLPEFAGQQVHCPHCQQIIIVPEADGYDHAALAPPPPAPPPADFPATPIGPILPPLSGPLPPPSVPQRSADVRHLSSKTSQSRQPVDSRAPVDPQDLYPPGYQSPGRGTEQPRPEPAASTPGGEPMLPPATGAPTSKRAETADLLPPGATAAATAPVERKPLPASVPTQAKKEVLIPTEKGYVGVSEPAKTVRHHGEEVELRKLTPEEKARRRLVRNTVLFAFCIITLIVVMALFMWK